MDTINSVETTKPELSVKEKYEQAAEIKELVRKIYPRHDCHV